MMLVLVLGTAVSFSSCSDDDDKGGSGDPNSIVGTWNCTIKDGSMEYFVEYTFKADGTGRMKNKTTYNGQSHSEAVNIVWKTSDNKLYMATYDDDEDAPELDVNNSRNWDMIAEYSLSGNTLKLTALRVDGKDTEHGNTMVLKRK